MKRRKNTFKYILIILSLFCMLTPFRNVDALNNTKYFRSADEYGFDERDTGSHKNYSSENTDNETIVDIEGDNYSNNVVQETTSSSCDSIFGSPEPYPAGCNAKAGECTFYPAYYIQIALNIIKYLAIVLCVVLTIFDFVSALVKDEKDVMKPLVNKTMIRLICVIALFFLPMIVKLVMSLVGLYGTCGIN